MLYGDKTTLRPAEAKDADLINRWCHDPALSGEDVPLAQYHLPGAAGQDSSARIFIIQNKGKAVGLMAARWPYGHRTPVELVGLVADPRERGQGLGTDALVTTLHYLFDTQPVTRIYIRCAVLNARVRRWLEGLGFKLDGIERELFYFHGDFQDIALYGMTRSDYDARWGKSEKPAPRRGENAPVDAPPAGRERPVRLSPERMAEEKPGRRATEPREDHAAERHAPPAPARERVRDERPPVRERSRPEPREERDEIPRRPARGYDADDTPRRPARDEREELPPRREAPLRDERGGGRDDRPPRKRVFRI